MLNIQAGISKIVNMATYINTNNNSHKLTHHRIRRICIKIRSSSAVIACGEPISTHLTLAAAPHPLIKKTFSLWLYRTINDLLERKIGRRKPGCRYILLCYLSPTLRLA